MIPLDFLRAVQESFLPDSCAIVRGTVVESGDGRTVTWATLAADVPCRVSPIQTGANESLGASGGVAAVNQWIVRVPAMTDVLVTDRVAYGARTFEVARVDARSYETVRDLICREIT